MRTTALEYLAEIPRLRSLLKGLPSSLPTESRHADPANPRDLRDVYSIFPSFQPDQEWLETTEDLPGSVGKMFKLVFGWNTDREKATVFVSRGKDVEAIADVLEQYLQHPGCQGNFGLLGEWVDRMIVIAENTPVLLPTGDNLPAPRPQERATKEAKIGNRPAVTSSASAKPPAKNPTIRKSTQKTLKAVDTTMKKKRKKGGNQLRVSSVPVETLIDIDESDSSRGRPCKPLLRKLTQLCYDPVDRGSDAESGEDLAEDDRKLRYRCCGVTKNGSRCPVSWGSRTQGRILKHAKHCDNLLPELRAAAGHVSAEASPVPALDAIIEREKGPNAEPLPKRIRLDVINKVPSGATKQTKLDNKVVPAGARAAQQTQLDAAILLLICTGGIPPTVVDSQEWRRVLIIATNSKYRPPSSDTLVDSLIPSEAARINEQVLKVLTSDSIDYATIGFDGGATAGRDSFTTVHATTSDRRAFFLDGKFTTNIKHTGECYAGIIKTLGRSDALHWQWISKISPPKIIACVSDNTGNTKAARRIVSEEYPTIINIQDACHQMHNTCKDICKLPAFTDRVKIVKAIIGHFSRSEAAHTRLTEERGKLGVRFGLQKVSKTRFGSIYWSTISVVDCFSIIQSLASEGLVPIKEKKVVTVLRSTGSAGNRFRCQADEIVDILAPLARAILCLESPHSTLADVMLFWAATCAWYRRLLQDPDFDIDDSTRKALVIIVNRRYREIINNGPHDAYIATLALDPRTLPSNLNRALLMHLTGYLRTDIFCECVEASKQPSSTGLKIRIPARPSANQTASQPKQPVHALSPLLIPEKVYKRIGTYLWGVLHAEKDSKYYSVLNALRWSDAKSIFLEQLNSYFRGTPPYNVYNGEIPLIWWRSHKNDPKWFLIAHLAIKLFSIVPNSMAEERTISTITWLNSRLRTGQSVTTLVEQTQIRQWHRYNKEKESKVSSPPKLDFARIRQYRQEVDPDDADESDDDKESDIDPDTAAPTSDDEEDPWDGDINLDSQLLLSAVTGANPPSSDARGIVGVQEESGSREEAGEWSEIEF